MTNRATQAELLDQRIAENKASQETDLVQWIFERVAIGPSDQILELCCGTGGQSLRMLSLLGDGGRLLALDISGEALKTLSGKVAAFDAKKLSTIQAGLDDLSPALERSSLRRPSFDLIFCAYGLYYSQDAKQTLQEAFTWLRPHGRMVVVGPFGPNNRQLFDMVEASGTTLSEAVVSSSQKFMLQTVVPWAALHFQSVRVSSMVNPVRWDTPERVLNYWANTTFYDAEKKPKFEALLLKHFAEHNEFVNEKWVMMVEMHDARA